MSAKIILQALCYLYVKVGKIYILIKICKFTIYRHLTITVNGPDFPVRCFETLGAKTDYFCLSGFKEHSKKKNPATFLGLI